MQGPRRGQEFSVDDAGYEIDEERAKKEASAAAKTSGSMRRQPSTLRRRPTVQIPALASVPSQENEEQEEQPSLDSGPPPAVDGPPGASSGEETIQAEAETPEDEDDDDDGDDDDDDGDDDVDLSDAESFTLKDRQEAINETHPFGIRIWKPALYKKDRSVQKNAEGDIHSSPGGNVGKALLLFNIAWTVVFGWWLALLSFFGGCVCKLLGFTPGCRAYGTVLFGLAGYLFYPFGKYVKLLQDETYAEEDEGEGRTITEYEQWQQGDLEEGRLFFGPIHINRSLIGRRRNSFESEDEETESLLGRTQSSGKNRKNRAGKMKRRLFGRGQWNVGRIVFYVFFYGLISPCLLLVSAICWFLVFTIPMGKVTLLLVDHLRRHPLALSFVSDSTYSRQGEPASAILMCTYRAVGTRYWKYTIDGTNIFLINLLGLVAFVIFDYYALNVGLGVDGFITSPAFIFLLALLSIIPLAYFIGQAVASISAQSTMGVGAAINAFFSTIVEVFLYCVALNQGKAQLVEGSVVGSVFAGILFLPGVSMCFGAIKRKTQRFNVKSASVTSTMLLFAVIGAFGPTLFYQIYGSHELNCHQCIDVNADGPDRDCQRCFFSQIPAVHDRFYVEAVRPYIWFAAVLLFLSYVIGLLFTLRTHAAVIWNIEIDEKKSDKTELMSSRTAGLQQPGQKVPADHIVTQSQSKQDCGSSNPGTLARSEIRDSQLYKRILSQSLRSVGMDAHGHSEPAEWFPDGRSGNKTAPVETGHPPQHVPPPPSDGDGTADQRSQRSMKITGLSEQENNNVVRQVAEMAATAAVVAARDVGRNPRKVSILASTSATARHERPHPSRAGTYAGDEEDTTGDALQGGGHDAPNWSRTKSTVVLLTATIAYAIIAEILVDTVDVVLESVDIDEKFLGITLFALVPNTTEFLVSYRHSVSCSTESDC